MRHPTVTVCMLIFALAALASGCGGDDDSGDSTTSSSSTTTNAGPPPKPPKPVEAPKAKKSIKDAADKLQKALDEGDCKAINKFNPISRQEALDTKEHCDILQTRLAGATVSGSQEFDGGGVIDFERGERTITALMIVDQDGKYHLVTLDGFLGKPSVDTKFADQFDVAARQAVTALVDKDCPAFLRAANRQLGPASAARSDKDICKYVKNNRIATLAGSRPSIAPQPLGGNADYALYGIGTQARFVTILMARQSNDNLPESASDLPSNAAEYGFVDVLPTNMASTGGGQGSGGGGNGSGGGGGQSSSGDGGNSN
jgi:hypothetical protein